jgi:hypothetical protein
MKRIAKKSKQRQKSKPKRYHYIYKVTNLINGTYYIGMHSTSNLNDGYMGSGKRLKRSYRLYGVDNHVFEVLEEFNSREELEKAEERYVTMKEVLDSKCLNEKVGGKGKFKPTPKQRFTERMRQIDYKNLFKT